MTSHIRFPESISENPISNYIWTTIYREDLNLLLLVCGGLGRCKSGTAITLANDLDITPDGKRRFTVDRIVFTAQDFVNLVQSDLPMGSVIIWDETGVEHDARNYYTQKNKLIKYVMQTSRYKNFIVLMPTPEMVDVDIGTRRLLQASLWMKGKVRNGNYAIGTFKYWLRNPEIAKTYRKHPRYYSDEKSNYIPREMTGIIFPKPPPELENPYKVKKDIAAVELYKNVAAQLEFMEKMLGQQHQEQRNLKELEEEVLKAPNRYIDIRHNRFSPALLENELPTKSYIAKNLAALLNMKLANHEITLPAGGISA